MIVFSSLQIRRGVRILLDNATATINPGQKVGLVGKNGCGKSTLLALLKNEISADGGSYTFPVSWQLAWVNQETPALPQAALEYVIDGDREYRQLEAQLHDANERNDGHAIATIHGKLDAIDAWSIRSRAASLLHGLGFSNEQLERPVSDFSGGWRMRLNLAQALICRSDLLLLDEPTNHLDLDAVIWLEKWLKSYQGTLILISHDRDFLDPIVDKIIHIEQQSMFEYTGNYSSFEVQRATRLAQQQAMYESQQERVAHLQSYIDRFRAKATKAKQAQSRIKMLERMELIAPAHVDNPFRFSFRAPESLPNPLLKMAKVSAGYGDRIILDSIKLNLVPGSRIGLLGRNGAGKSTLIKLLAGELAPVSGEIGLAKGIKLGYFAQHQLEYLRADESPIQHLARLAPQELEQKLRDYLGGFGFQGDKVTEETRRFSGGEKARLVLALIVWQRPNLLLLDEPTNHLDAESVAWLERFLHDFEGTVVAITHDRYFLDNVAGWILELDRGEGIPWEGNYSSWLEQKDQRLAQEASQEAARRKSIEKELEWVRQGTKGRQSKGKARLARFEELNSTEYQKRNETNELFIPPGPRLGDKVLEVSNLRKSYGDRLLIDDLSFSIPKGAIVGIIGPNGAGKSTLFRMISGQEQPDSGTITLGETVKLASVDQFRDSMDNSKTVWEEVSGGLDIMKIGNTEMPSRAYVGRFNFKGVDQGKRVGELSGGERGRLHLAKLLQVGGNMLLLDEPTNDLDIETLRALENALLEFPGCAMVISHDRWFLDRIATHILDYQDEGKVEFFEGNFTEYEEYKKRTLGADALEPKRIKYKRIAK